MCVPKLGKPGGKTYIKANIFHVNIFHVNTFFLANQQSVKLLYEMLDTLIEALTVFTVRQITLKLYLMTLMMISSLLLFAFSLS